MAPSLRSPFWGRGWIQHTTPIFFSISLCIESRGTLYWNMCLPSCVGWEGVGPNGTPRALCQRVHSARGAVKGPIRRAAGPQVASYHKGIILLLKHRAVASQWALRGPGPQRVPKVSRRPLGALGLFRLACLPPTSRIGLLYVLLGRKARLGPARFRAHPSTRLGARAPSIAIRLSSARLGPGGTIGSARFALGPSLEIGSARLGSGAGRC